MTVKDNEILWAKVKPDATIPTKRDEDAGYDIYPCFEEDCIIIPPHETKLISTGIASAFSKDYVAVLKERGSTGTKGIAQRSGIIDSGFRNEWLVPITNTSERGLIITDLSIKELISKYGKTSDFGWTYIDDCIYLDCGGDKDFGSDDLPIIYPYSKAICQALILPIPKINTREVSYEELQTVSSERGLGMLGSSNK
ncbi:dUTP pyrophosphatase [Clostridium sp. HBUAS56010]|uniref:dUTP pyrophosphatase n=1 Tax=Clostridium sp. HBUAS56010 TaxID=2571127 RepID=UPI00117772D6|nr:dUTP pyrophosphatase [Clostridium sp. HBUAS56010]